MTNIKAEVTVFGSKHNVHISVEDDASDSDIRDAIRDEIFEHTNIYDWEEET